MVLDDVVRPGVFQAKGDILAGNFGGTRRNYDRLPAGPDGQALIADSSQPLGLAYSGVALPFINVKMPPYNAKGDGVTDDTSALQAWLNAVVASGGIGYLPPGTYKTSATLLIQNKGNFIIMGAGKNVSIISPTTALAGLPVLKLSNCRDSAIRDLRIMGNTSGAPSCGINSRIESPRTLASLMLEFSNLIIGSDSGSSLTDGILFDADVAGGYDQNNEQHTVQNCETRGIVNAGIKINNSNANHIKIIGGQIASGAYSVQVGSNGGNFDIVGTWLGATTSKFDIQGMVRHSIHISQVGSEDSSKLLTTNTTSNIKVTFEQCDIQGGMASVNDVDFQSVGGILTFKDCIIVMSAAGSVLSVSDPTAWLFLDGGQISFNGGISCSGHFDGAKMINDGTAAPPHSMARVSWKTITANYTTNEVDSGLVCNSASALTITLHSIVTTPVPAKGRFIIVYNNGAGLVTVTSGDNGIGGGPVTIAQNHCAWFSYDSNAQIGNFWWCVAKF